MSLIDLIQIYDGCTKLKMDEEAQEVRKLIGKLIKKLNKDFTAQNKQETINEQPN